MEKFYYVIGQSAGSPTKQHNTYGEALREAERLVLDGKVAVAWVCEVQAKVCRAVETTDIFPKHG